jgi:nicotinate-nucleotide--dimethylbenzimidazole phosphoribosyltransferase
MNALLDVGAAVDWPDADAAAAARAAGRPQAGRLAELAEWLAAAQGHFPPHPLHRVCCVVAGEPTARVAELAAATGVTLRPVTPPDEPVAAFATGTALADDAAETNTDLLVLAGTDEIVAPAVAVALLTGAEPVALLPRGAAAVDSAAWMARAERLRDGRRRAAADRSRPDRLLAALGSPAMALLAGLALRAAARRTPAVLDGPAALAAALLGADVQARAVRWWQVADSAGDPVSVRALDQLAATPLLALGTAGDGTAGLLAVAVLRAAVTPVRA